MSTGAWRFTGLLVAVVGFGVPSTVWARTDCSISHEFSIQAASPGAAALVVRGGGSGVAQVRDGALLDAQRYTSGGLAVPGAPYVDSRHAGYPRFPFYSSAEADSRVSVSAVTDTVVSGTVTSSSYTDLRARSSIGLASAFSSATVSVSGGWNLSRGSIQWRPQFTDATSDAASKGGKLVMDSVDWSILEAATNVVLAHGVMLEVRAEVAGGKLNWNGDRLAGSGSDMHLGIAMDSPVTARGGTLDLEIVDQQVVRAEDSGVFEGTFAGSPLLPSFDIHLANTIEVGYDLGPVPAGYTADQLIVRLDLSGGADPQMAALPPAAVVAWPLLTVLGAARVLRRRSRQCGCVPG